MRLLLCLQVIKACANNAIENHQFLDEYSSFIPAITTRELACSSDITRGSSVYSTCEGLREHCPGPGLKSSQSAIFWWQINLLAGVRGWPNLHHAPTVAWRKWPQRISWRAWPGPYSPRMTHIGPRCWPARLQP